MQEIVFKLLLSIALGGIIGIERQFREKAAGFRTIIIICLGTTIFTVYSSKFAWGDPSRIAAGIVTGIGFLGAGVILQNRGQVTGLTTAATIWFAAALGMGIGIGEYYISGLSVLSVLAVLVFFHYIENYVGKFHESHLYQIKVDFDKLDINEYETYFKNNGLKIIKSKRFKKHSEIILTWKLIGKSKNHEILKIKLMNDNNLNEFISN